eukprot:gene7060-6696_t
MNGEPPTTYAINVKLGHLKGVDVPQDVLLVFRLNPVPDGTMQTDWAKPKDGVVTWQEGKYSFIANTTDSLTLDLAFWSKTDSPDRQDSLGVRRSGYMGRRLSFPTCYLTPLWAPCTLSSALHARAAQTQ